MVASGWRQCVLPIIVGTTGCLAAVFFLGFGISSLVTEQENLFEIRAAELVANFQFAWEDYEASSRWLYVACGGHTTLSRVDFLHIYEYFADGLLEVQVRSSCISNSWDKRILSHIYLNFRPWNGSLRYHMKSVRLWSQNHALSTANTILILNIRE